MKLSLCASDAQKEKYPDFIKDLQHHFTLEPFNASRSAPVVVVLGGDGTLNYLINNVPAPNVRVIYFPTGTANDFARSLKIPVAEPHLSKVHSILRQNLLLPIPVMDCNGIKFLNVASVGAPARVTQSGDDLLKNVMGKISYYISGLEELLSSGGDELTYQIDDSPGQRLSCRGFLVSQGLYAGGGVKVSTSYAPNFGREFNFLTVSDPDLKACLSTLLELQKDIPAFPAELVSQFGETLRVSYNTVMPAKLDGEEYQAKNFVFKKDTAVIHFFCH